MESTDSAPVVQQQGRKKEEEEDTKCKNKERLGGDMSSLQQFHN